MKLKRVLHDRPVIGLRGSHVGGGAQFAPGPLVVSAAASSIAVRLLTERIGHGVSPKDTEHRLSISPNHCARRRAEVTEHTNHQLLDQYHVVSNSLSPASPLINKVCNPVSNKSI